MTITGNNQVQLGHLVLVITWYRCMHEYMLYLCIRLYL